MPRWVGDVARLPSVWSPWWRSVCHGVGVEVVGGDEDCLDEVIQLGQLFNGEDSEQGRLDGDGLGEVYVDQCPSCVGDGYENLAAIGRVGVAGHQCSLLEPVQEAGHAATGEVQVGVDLVGGQGLSCSFEHGQRLCGGQVEIVLAEPSVDGIGDHVAESDHVAGGLVGVGVAAGELCLELLASEIDRGAPERLPGGAALA